MRKLVRSLSFTFTKLNMAAMGARVEKHVVPIYYHNHKPQARRQ